MHTVESVICEAKQNKWPFPKKFQGFKDAGVTSYTVHFVNQFDATYKGDFGTWHEPAPVGYMPSKLSEQFSVDKVKQAIRNNIAGKTNYAQFLEEIAHAGVSHYTVDINSRRIIYFNEDETERNEEQVPEWKK